MLSSRAVVQRIAVRTGYPVVAAWSQRSHGSMGTVLGVVRHHTGTRVNHASTDDYPTLRVVRDGRADLLGPLCTWGIGRSGTVYLISPGVGWHAGGGRWRGTTDANGHFWGIEAESDGKFWTPAETDCYHRLVASALHELGRGWEWAPRHADWATPAGRKSDAGGMDEALFERRVRAMLANPSSINRNAIPAAPVAAAHAPLKDADMPLSKDDLAAIKSIVDISVAYYALRAVGGGMSGVTNKAFNAEDTADWNLKAQLAPLVAELAAAKAREAVTMAAIVAAGKTDPTLRIDYDRLEALVDAAAARAVAAVGLEDVTGAP